MSRGPRGKDVVLDREYDGTTKTLRAARTDMVGCLRSKGVDEDVRDRAELVFSELASNAVQAAPGDPYCLRLTVGDDGSVVMTVTSQTRHGVPPPRELWGPESPLAPSGRGLIIADELADALEIDRPAAGTVVVTAILH
jgi:anti-sigma regulatory factor (Ser/Thr protein kinase)